MAFLTVRRACAVAVLVTVAGALPGSAWAQTPEERVAARDLASKRSSAVIMVLATLKARRASDGAAGDVPVVTNGTIIDATGLTVVPLSVLDPGPQAGRGGTITTEMSELRMHLADGREVPANVVLRDPDLDLAYLRPLEAPASPLPAVDAISAVPGLADLAVVVQRSTELSGWGTFLAFTYVQMVVDHPRNFYIVSTNSLNFGGLGSALFDSRGRFIGVIARIGGTRGNPLLGVVPADDIRDVAKQVPAVK